MTTYIVRRVLQSIVILLGLTVVFFTIEHLAPGGPCQAEGISSPKAIVAEKVCMIRLGLNQPLPVQYEKWAGGLLHGNLGRSITGESVSSDIMAALPVTIMLATVSYIFQLLIALPLGILSALKQYSFVDQILTFLSYVGISMPTFFLGLMLIYVFAIHWPVFPPAGVESTYLPSFFSHDWFVSFSQNPGRYYLGCCPTYGASWDHPDGYRDCSR